MNSDDLARERGLDALTAKLLAAAAGNDAPLVAVPKELPASMPEHPLAPSTLGIVLHRIYLSLLPPRRSA